jgi:hypothetical protein
MMDLYAIHDTDGVKQMISEGKVVGLRKGALVYLESVDVRDGIVKETPRSLKPTKLQTHRGIPIDDLADIP